MSATRKSAVAIWRRRTGGAAHDTGVATVSLGGDAYAYRVIQPVGNGKFRRTQWALVSRESLVSLLAQRSRMDMWNGRAQALKDGIDEEVDWVPRYGLVELELEPHGGARFEQRERRRAMAVVDDDANLPVVPLQKPPGRDEGPLHPNQYRDRAQDILAALEEREAVVGQELWAPARAAQRPAPEAAPVVPAADPHGYPEILTENRRQCVQLERGRHFLRKLAGTGVTDVELLRTARESFSPVLLLGQAGTGKTQSVLAAFGEHNIITVLGHEEVEAASFEGRYTPKEGGGWKITLGKLVRAMQEGKVLFIDEIGLISPLVLSILYSAMDGRRSLEPTLIPDIGVVEAQPGFYVAGAANPGAPGSRITDAMRSRFPYRPVVGTDYRMAVSHLGVPEDIASAAANLEERRLARELSWAPQLRDLVQYVRAVEDFNEELALAALAGKAPDPDQRTVCEVLGREVGRTVKPLAVT